MYLTRSQYLWLLLISVGLLRMASLAMYPLMDTTESRYGEIARIMVETGNWVTPQIDYDIAFWGKPPLYAWVSASSIYLLGNTEFNLRLPHFLSAILVLILLWKFTRHLKFSPTEASYSVSVVATSAGFLIAAGAIMTDMLLCLSMAMSMTGFWRSWHGARRYNIMLYTGLALGLLAKGPIIMVLVGLAVFPWLVIHYGLIKMWREVWLRLNLLPGLMLMLLISAPWYILAERATPGFLEYFFIGEHFYRFIDSGWQGDLYGAGHAKARGTIWLYWLVFTFPWSPLILWMIIRHFFSARKISTVKPGLNSFLLLWLCSPMLLFTFAGNILPAYILPGLPATGLLIIVNYDFLKLNKKHALFIFGPLLMLIFMSYLSFYNDDNFSEKTLLKNGIDSPHPLYYYISRPYSAQYYSNGRALVVKSLPDQQNYYLAIKKDRLFKAVELNCQLKSENRDRYLYFCSKTGD